MNDERVEYLENKIKDWKAELKIYEGKNTDVAEVERRNLLNQISNAQREINEYKNGPEVAPTLEELEKEVADIKKDEEKRKKLGVKRENKPNKEEIKKLTLERNQLTLQIERLEEEIKNYDTQKNRSYRDIYAEYEKQIKERKDLLSTIEDKLKLLNETQADIDRKLRVTTALRIKYEEQKTTKQKEIRLVKREIEDIEFGTEESMVEKELSDGTKTKTPKILDLYEKIKKLENELRNIESKIDECQNLIDNIKGIEKDKDKEKKEEHVLSPEEIKYYHNQGDQKENTRDDRRGNDEYFGFEKGDNVKPTQTMYTDPNQNPKDPGQTPKDPDPKPKDPDPKLKDPDPKLKDPDPKLKDPDPKPKDPDPKLKDPDPKPKDPDPKSANTKLPIRSFWEIYNDTNNIHTNTFLTRAQQFSHASIWKNTGEDALTYALGIPGKLFSTPIKVGAKLITGIAGTNKKYDELCRNIDQLSNEEFDILVRSSDETNKINYTYLKSEHDIDYLNPEFMKEYKTDELYLAAVRNRLARETENGVWVKDDNENDICIELGTNQINEYMEALDRRIEDFKSREPLSNLDKIELANLCLNRNQLEGRSRKLTERVREFDEGIKRKSSKFTNIRGWFLAKFNPDNREQNSKMAEFSRQRREAEQQGDQETVALVTDEMDRFSREQSEHSEGVISRDKYARTGKVEKLNRGEETRGRKLLTDIALVMGGISVMKQIKANRATQEAIENYNNEIQKINDQNRNISGTVKVGESPEANDIASEVAKSQVGGGMNMQERADFDNPNSNWHWTESYIQNDAANHATSKEIADTVQNQINSGNGINALGTSAKYYDSISSGAKDIFEAYAKENPQFAYEAPIMGTNANATKIADWFSNGTVPFSVSGTTAPLMDQINLGVYPLSVIYASMRAAGITYRNANTVQSPRRNEEVENNLKVDISENENDSTIDEEREE